MVAGLWAVSWVMLGLSGALPVTFAVVAICLSTAVFALGETLSAPIMPSLVNDLAPAHLRGRYNAVQSITWGVSGALGPAIAGASEMTQLTAQVFPVRISLSRSPGPLAFTASSCATTADS